MNRWLPSALALSAALLTACATTPAQDPAALSRVRVDWSDPAQFADTRTDQCRTRAKPEEWLGQLARYVQSRAASLLPVGQTLAVTITDIQRAGRCEPWRGPRMDDVRVIKNIYPPRIDLSFRLSDANGHVVAEGTRKLSDMGFLQRGGVLDSNDPLRYEKRLLSDWLRRELAAPATH